MIIDSPCQKCSGRSRIQKRERLQIKIPAGIRDGARLRISKKGDAGVYGGSSGDLYIVVHVEKDKRFYRSGKDLVTNVELTYPQLTLGAQIEIENIDDKKIAVRIPKATAVGEKIRVRNKGFKSLSGEDRGDLVVVVGCLIPKKSTEEERQLLIKYESELKKRMDKSKSDGLRGFFKRFLK